MRFLIFNIAVALALVYLVTGKTIEGIGNDAISQVSEIVKTPAVNLSSLLDQTVTKTLAIQPSPNVNVPEKTISNKVHSSGTPESHVELPQKNTLDKSIKNKTTVLASAPPSGSVIETSGDEDKLPEISMVAEVSELSVNHPTDLILPKINKTEPKSAYMNLDQRSGELERLVDDMELFAVRMLKK